MLKAKTTYAPMHKEMQEAFKEVDKDKKMRNLFFGRIPEALCAKLDEELKRRGYERGRTQRIEYREWLMEKISEIK